MEEETEDKKKDKWFPNLKTDDTQLSDWFPSVITMDYEENKRYMIVNLITKLVLLISASIILILLYLEYWS